MSELPPEYHATPVGALGHDAHRLPKRAVNLARRLLELERQCAGRGRLTLDLIMVDGDWLLSVSKPGKVEHLSE